MILLSLYSLTVKHYLTEKLYPAVAAGLVYFIMSGDCGLLVKVGGLSEKLPLMLDLIGKELKNIPNQLEPLVFEVYKEQLKKSAHTALMDSNTLSENCCLTVLEEQHDFCFDRFVEVEEVKFEELVAFAKNFPQGLKIKMLMMGNFHEDEAIKSAKNLHENLQSKSCEDEKILLPRCRKLPAKSQKLCVQNFLPKDQNSTITNYYQICKSSIRNQCLVEFVEHLMTDPISDILELEDELGYSMSFSHRVNNGQIGFIVSLQIQEDKHSTKSVNSKVENFLREDFKNILDNLSDIGFENVQKSLIKLKKTLEVEMESESNRHWNEITSHEYIFNRPELEAEMMSKITKEEVKEFYLKILNSPKLSIQVIGNNKGEEGQVPSLKLLQDDESGDDNVIKDLSEFTSSLEFYED